MREDFDKLKQETQGSRRSKDKSIEQIGDDDIIRDPDMLYALEGLGITTWTEFWESNRTGDKPIQLK